MIALLSLGRAFVHYQSCSGEGRCPLRATRQNATPEAFRLFLAFAYARSSFYTSVPDRPSRQPEALL
jgi:hypothetical protein